MIKNNTKGTAMVFYAITLSVICGFTALIVDIGNVVNEKSKLQNAVDAASLAAGIELPDTQTAKLVANHYLEANGYTSKDFTVTFANNNNQINVVAKQNIPFTFAKVFGIDSSFATCKSSAVGDFILKNALSYALFSGSTTTRLSLNGSEVYVYGDAHANNDIIITGNNQTITGTCDAVGKIKTNANSINIVKTEYSSFVEMIDFSALIKEQAKQSGQYYIGDKTYNESFLNVNQPIYVEGNLTINGSHFTGTGSIFATGNITFNGSNVKDSTSSAVCFYTSNGNIRINGSNVVLDGIVYAPKGDILLNGSNQLINGRVVGNTVTFNGSNLTIASSPRDLKALPKRTSKLVK